MNRIVLTTAFIAFCTAMMAQRQTGTWSLTPRVGVNSSCMSVEDMYVDTSENHKASAKHKWGFVGGLDAEYQTQQQVGISVGMFYSNEGYTYGEVADIGKITQTTHYLNVPVLVNFYIEPDMLPGLALKAGVQLGYLMKAKFSDGLGSYSRGDNTDSFKHVNLSIPAGISYTYHNFEADLRYNIGVTNVCKNVAGTDWSWKTNSLWLTLGYRFGL